ncbi:uncharacterized protein VTP21DRAFT_2137 [Calcarisporiella thermophila]|uniref:uncharacterized protein n=1 Tax=Calcarisporiella thermophila TaxID=911321 RepID=UPI00374211EA
MVQRRWRLKNLDSAAVVGLRLPPRGARGRGSRFVGTRGGGGGSGGGAVPRLFSLLANAKVPWIRPSCLARFPQTPSHDSAAQGHVSPALARSQIGLRGGNKGESLEGSTSPLQASEPNEGQAPMMGRQPR